MLISNANLNGLGDEIAGVTAVTVPRNLVTAITAGVSGTMYAQLITLPPGLTVNNLDFWMTASATTPAHQWMALMTAGPAAGTILAVTGDNTGGQQVGTYYRAPVTAPFTTPPGAGVQPYYIGVMLAATTMGTVAGGPAVPNVINNLPAGTLSKFVTAGSGYTTPLAIGTAVAYVSVTGAQANIYAATA